MSREVRRVPVGWQHPVEPNPHWLFQSSIGAPRPASRLHGPTEQFVSLMDDYPGAVARYEANRLAIRQREGSEWTWPLGYYLEGWTDRDGNVREPQPFVLPSGDGEYVEVRPTDRHHLAELLLQRIVEEEPDPADYMPVFDVPADELGWCLYQTVSEGTPTTPVFATAEELIEHLVTVGEDYDQKPYRREAAEQLVRTGFSLGSFVIQGGQMFDGAKDIDRIGSAL